MNLLIKVFILNIVFVMNSLTIVGASTKPSKIIQIQEDDDDDHFGDDTDNVEIFSGNEHNIIPSYIASDKLGSYPINPYINYPFWRASATLMTSMDNIENGPSGEIIFRQSNRGEPILVTINATGLPSGKHALHIHAFGDLREGCKSTGPHIRNILIGNINVKEDNGGSIDISFHSPYVNLFGPRGVIGRSIVIHEKPIEFHRFPDIYGIPNGINNYGINPLSYQTEEMVVGGMIACGIITITDNLVH